MGKIVEIPYKNLINGGKPVDKSKKAQDFQAHSN